MTSQRLAATAALLLLLPAAAGAQSAVPSASPGGSPSPTATAAASPGAQPTPSAAMTAQARAEYEAFRSGKVDRSHYDAEMVSVMSDATIADVAQHLQALGPVQHFTYERTLAASGHTLYVYRISFAKPPELFELIAWDPAGKIERLLFRQAST